MPRRAHTNNFWDVDFTRFFLFVDFFDTAGTLTSVANVAGKVGKDGKVKDINKAMLSDSVSTVAGAVMGTTTVTSYVESGAGVKAGGKTGMTSLVIGILFLACIFFAPLATSLPKQIDGAALLFVSYPDAVRALERLLFFVTCCITKGILVSGSLFRRNTAHFGN